MNEDYPLYPPLTSDGEKEAQLIMDRFKESMLKASEEILSDIYCDVAVHIESDSWTNYKNKILDGLCDYGNRRDSDDYDFKKIRQSILKHHRDEIIDDLNTDMVNEIESLKKQLQNAYDSRYGERNQ